MESSLACVPCVSACRSGEKGSWTTCCAGAAWGHGYATEAARAWIAFGFASLDKHGIQAYCDVQNAASARVLEQAGMRREGFLRQHLLVRCRWRDSYLYDILEDDWRLVS